MSESYISLGIMSGTSQDGLDLALCSFSENAKGFDYKILKSETLPYSTQWRKKLSFAQQNSAEELVILDHEYGTFIGEAINRFLAGEKTRPQIISSHGHTIFHRPEKGFTLQIGHGANIAAVSGITTVCDFRSIDVALNGQGAPLVPIGDELLFAEFQACLNLGGISNISFVKDGKRIAFDIGAVNMVINYLAGKLGLAMDMDGIIANSGKTDTELFKSLNADPYYFLPDKKTIGREWVEKNVIEKLNRFTRLSIEDKISTFTEHAAFQVAEVIRKNKLEKILVTGGGAYNKYLLKKIKEYSGLELTLPAKEIIEFKEALIFAFLGYLRMQGKINTLKSVTGAKRDSCGGAVYCVDH